MKFSKIIFFGLLLVFTFGCESDLKSVDYSEINPAIFPQTESDVEALVVAAYNPLRGAWGLDIKGIHNTSERGVMFINDATTEILYGDFGVQLYATFHSYGPENYEVTFIYDEYYNEISSNTLSIDRIENSSVPDNLKKTGIAEIKCARALLSYELFDMYGPLVVAPLELLKNPLIEEPLARLTNDEMVSFIEQDLLDAAADLPHPSEADYGRFSQGMARMLLIRLYLHQKRWEDVEEQANLIIAMGHYELDEDYVGLWGTETPSASKEIIWAVPADYAGTSENQWQLMVLPANYPEASGWSTIQSTWKFYDSFEDNDIRKTALIAEYVGTDGVTYNRNNPGTNIQYGPIPLKMDLDVERSGLTTVDIIVYRYADVLLSKAEALANKTGVPTQAAIDLVNIVRNRAGLDDLVLADYADIDTFNTMILLERSHEYWCENGQYRADLIRHGKFSEYNIDLVGSAASETAAHKVVYPFSFSQVTEGKGAFVQNPGYSN